MTSQIDVVAAALKDRFKRRIEETRSQLGAPVPFEKTGVEMPADEIWRDYASVALQAIGLE